MKFENRVALVVGSATGMGAATVAQLYAEGAHVIAFDVREDALEELTEDVSGGPGTLETFLGDVNDKKSREACIAKIKEDYGRIDIYAYVAGVLDLMTPAHATDDELWDYVMDVNVNSVFRMTREALPLLLDHDGVAASITIVGSIGGIFGSTAGAAYITSKHAVLGLVKNLAWSYRDRNVRVNAVNPGAIASSILENAMIRWPDRDPMHPDGPPLFADDGAVTLDGGRMGDPEDIANAVCFLASDEASYICGSELTVDGGWTCF